MGNMQKSTTIEGMLTSNTIFVPTYQRAYSWDIDPQVKTFLADLEEYNRSKTDSKYYFGHFLFDEKDYLKKKKVNGKPYMVSLTASKGSPLS